MKRSLIRFLTQTTAVITLVFVAGSCRDEGKDIAPAKGNMSLSLITPADIAAGGRTAEAPQPAGVFLTVEGENGYKKQYVNLELLAFGDGYVSENLELPVGNYRLTMFHVMNSERRAIYSTPREGSAMAQFVTDPLDIEFEIREDVNTQVNPEVLPVGAGIDPGIFGYASFAFQKVDVTAMMLPESDENIVRVTYEFKNLFSTIKGEGIPVDGVLALDNKKLYNNIWQAQINVFTEKKDCATTWSNTPYQKVYRLATEMVFTGAPIQLPEYGNIRWEPFYYRTSSEIGYFFSANPAKSYNVEIEIYNERIEADYTWMDRIYWNGNGGEICGPTDDPYASIDMNGARTGKLMMKDRPECETNDLLYIDSFVAINSNRGPFHEFFSWTLVNGEYVPSCDVPELHQNNLTVKERKAPKR